jgi:uncharacterized membrane protein YccC
VINTINNDPAMNDTHKNLLLYMTKCVAAAGLIFYFSDVFHYSDIIWCLISAVLVLSPNAKEAIPLALTRIAANFVGSAAILLCLLLGGLPHIVIISLAYCLAIAACYLFNLMTASRSALAATTIIMFAPANEAHIWDKPLERVVSVAAGCVVGLVVTLIIHRQIPGSKKAVADDPAE